jgi:hypothetical protein
MNALIGGVLMLFAALGGFWGWRRGTKSLYRRSLHSERPDSVSAYEYERRTIAARKRWRLFITAMFGIGGAVVGYGLLLAVALRR